MSVTDLPTINAILNSTSAVLLICGYWMIRRQDMQAHKRFMLAAFAVSTLFLVCYVVYHYNVGSVRYQKTDWTRPVYFTILVSHTILAAAVPFLALISLRRAWQRKFDRHRAISRWTLPIWLYVSVTGVVVYWMLYRL